MELDVLQNELDGLKSRISALERKTALISVDEQNGTLRICKRVYFFGAAYAAQETEKAWVIVEGSTPGGGPSSFLTGSSDFRSFAWTKNLEDALRFSRAEDAKMVIDSFGLKEVHPEERTFPR